MPPVRILQKKSQTIRWNAIKTNKERDWNECLTAGIICFGFSIISKIEVAFESAIGGSIAYTRRTTCFARFIDFKEKNGICEKLPLPQLRHYIQQKFLVSQYSNTLTEEDVIEGCSSYVINTSSLQEKKKGQEMKIPELHYHEDNEGI